MKLYQLLYVSDSRRAMSEFELDRLVTACRRKNSERNITGLLLYSGGHFIQLLEGHPPVLANLFDKIGKDERHHNVTKLHFAACKQRLFPKWQMGLLNLETINELDRSRLAGLIGRLDGSPTGPKILSALREFRTQLPVLQGGLVSTQ